MKLLVFSLALVILSWQLASASAKGVFNQSGVVKDAWPEYLFREGTEVEQELRNSGLVDTIFLQGPTPPEQSPPFFPGTHQSVWIYTGYDGLVYQIPKRGIWHFNRVSPGWPELVGVNYLKAIATIQNEVIGVTGIYGPRGFLRPFNVLNDRVFLDVDGAGKVALVPKVG